jgi:hypothetical protein
MNLFSHAPRGGFHFLEFAAHLTALIILRDVMKPNILISSCWKYQMEEDEIVGACSTQGRHDSHRILIRKPKMKGQVRNLGVNVGISPTVKKDPIYLCICLIVCDAFNDAVNWSGYMLSDGRMINE